MSVILTICCDDIIDLDYDCDDVVYVDDEPYHWDCAVSLGLITQQQAESNEYVFYTK